MDGQADFSDLIARVEAATCADRELDGDLYWALERPRAQTAYWNAAMGRPRVLADNFKPTGLGRQGVIAGSPKLTSSVDAALALIERVLPDVLWRVGFEPDSACIRAELITAAPECKLSIGDHDAPALAVCLALLKAKAAQS